MALVIKKLTLVKPESNFLLGVFNAVASVANVTSNLNAVRSRRDIFNGHESRAYRKSALSIYFDKRTRSLLEWCQAPIPADW